MPGTIDMPRGRDSRVRFKPQTDFRTAASGTGFFELNTYAHDSTKTIDFGDDDVLGATGLHNGMDARPAAPGLEDAAFAATYPLDLTQFGFILQQFFGGPSTSGSGPYTHVFASGASTIPVNTVERQLKSGQFRKVTGATLRSLAFDFARGESGYHEVRAEYLAREVSEKYGASVATTPTVLSLGTRVPKFVSNMTIDSVSTGRLTQGSLTLTNVLGSDRYGERQMSEAWREGVMAELDVTARYVDETLPDLGNVGTDGYLPDPHQVSIFYTINNNLYLQLGFSAMRFRPTSPQIQGGGATTVQMRGRAEVGSGALCVATLVNSRATYP